MTFLTGTIVPLADSNITLTAADVIKGIFSQTATAPRVITFPSAADIIGEAGNVKVSDTFPIVFINGGNSQSFAVPASGTLNLILNSVSSNERRNFNLRIDDVTPGSEAYTITDLDTP